MKHGNSSNYIHSISRKKIFGIHGGGNIGLGCMADIVSKSSIQYQIIATSSDRLMNELINANNQFWLKYSLDQKTHTNKVSHVMMLNSREPKNIIWLYTYSNLMALCLTEKALLNVAAEIARGLISRYENNRKKLKILILMNKPNGEKWVYKEIFKSILAITHDFSYAEKILSIIEFVPTVVDRIVTKIDKPKILIQLRKQLTACFPTLISKKRLNEHIENILKDPDILRRTVQKFNLKFNLFSAEKDFILYVPHYFKEASHFDGVKPVKNLLQYAEVKNKYLNGPHAMLAWMGGLMGCKTIAEAINNPSMLWFINNVMEKEIAPILKAEYPSMNNDELKSLKDLFIKRCKKSFEDPIVRVGRDPLRKLSGGGRIRGIIELRKKHNLKIATPELERGMAAGILYATKQIDPHNAECQTIQAIYQRDHSYQAVLCYNGPYEEGNYRGLDSSLDHSLINSILKRINSFEKICKIKTH